MVYSGGFVICVLVKGQVQPERADGIVIVPEGTEYSIRLRNKNNRRAVGKIFIDGENVSDGGYVVNAFDYVDIHRFANKDEAFKVAGINSPEAVDAGKNGPNDGTKGVIEVRFKLERQPEPKTYPLVFVTQHTNKRSWPTPKSYSLGPEKEERTSGGITLNHVEEGASENCRSLFNCSFNASPIQESKLDDAVTVGGSSTGQRFSYTILDLELQETILKIILKIGEPTVKSYYCTKCGIKLGKTDNFCSKCGKQILLAR